MFGESTIAFFLAASLDVGNGYAADGLVSSDANGGLCWSAFLVPIFAGARFFGSTAGVGCMTLLRI
jgi:hypothetical protein